MISKHMDFFLSFLKLDGFNFILWTCSIFNYENNLKELCLNEGKIFHHTFHIPARQVMHIL